MENDRIKITTKEITESAILCQILFAWCVSFGTKLIYIYNAHVDVQYTQDKSWADLKESIDQT